MKTCEIIGQTVTNILVWSKMEMDGLDEAEVYIELNNCTIIEIPLVFNSRDLETEPRKGSKSIFSNITNEMPVYSIKPVRKSIVSEKLNNVFGRIKNHSQRSYSFLKTGSVTDNSFYLKNQKIVDFLVVEKSFHSGFIELENGYIFTETTVSPHGTGLSGLNFFENIESFEKKFGKQYKRITSVI